MNYGSIDHDTGERRVLRVLQRSRKPMSTDDIYRETGKHAVHTYVHGINAQWRERGESKRVECSRGKDGVYRYSIVTPDGDANG